MNTHPEVPAPNPAHAADMVDHYWGAVQHIQSLIKASELKAGLLLSFYGILLNFVYQGATSSLAASTLDLPLLVAGGVWFVLAAASILYSVRCFVPRIEIDYDPNVFFFGDVITKFGDVKAFAKTFYRVSLDEEALFLQLGEQMFVLSKIAAWKFRNVNRAIALLGASLLVLLGIVAGVTLRELT